VKLRARRLGADVRVVGALEVVVGAKLGFSEVVAVREIAWGPR
jgi:hypothetical protein